MDRMDRMYKTRLVQVESVVTAVTNRRDETAVRRAPFPSHPSS